MFELLFLNRRIEEFLGNNSYTTNLKKERVKALLQKEYPKRIRPDLIEKINSLFDNDESDLIKLDPSQFQSIESEVGKTYVLFVNNLGHNYQLGGYCFLLKIEFDSKNFKSTTPKDKFFLSFEENFNRCFDYVARILEEDLENSYFFRGIKDKLNIKLLNPFKEILTFEDDFNVEFTGNSIELPFTIAIFSALTGLKIDSSIACSGNINENLEVTYVDGIKEKILGAVKEYPEIKTFIFPDDCRKLNVEKEFNGIEMKYVKTLREAFEIFFGNFKDRINKIKFAGKIDLKVEEVITLSNDKALLITLDYDYAQGNLDPQILQFFTEDKIDSKLKEHNSKIYLLDNFRPIWFIPALMKFFVNKCDAVGVYNKELDSFVIVYTGRSFNKFRVGDSIKLKNS